MWMDSMKNRYTCQHCIDSPNIPAGYEKQGIIQLHGVWLCQFHYENLINNDIKYQAFRQIQINKNNR